VKTIRDLLDRDGAWLAGTGPSTDTVLSTRVRLARNLASHPFPSRAREEQLAAVLGRVETAAASVPGLRGARLLRMGDLAPSERQFLVERHLISHELAQGSKTRGLLVGRDETVSAMLNEEDHVRLQTLLPGFQLSEAWDVANAVDDDFGASLEYAFSPEIGYLTACPTNAGTGMRASVLIHLPALVLTKQVRKVVKGVLQVGLAVRGFYGEGSEIMGNFFQMSNQTTLGKSEHEILMNLERVTTQIIEYEARARDVLLKDARVQIEDKVYRALGTLRYSRSISSQEVVSLTSAVRLGVALGLPGLPPVHVLNRLLILTQPAHLMAREEKEMDAPRRNVLRAGMARKLLEAY
jgi:protein arginine kinase